MGDFSENHSATVPIILEEGEEPELILLSDSEELEDMNIDSNGDGGNNTFKPNTPTSDPDSEKNVLDEIIQLIDWINTHGNNQLQSDSLPFPIKTKFKDGFMFIESLQTMFEENQNIITEKDERITAVVAENEMLEEEIKKLRRELNEQHLRFEILRQTYEKLEEDGGNARPSKKIDMTLLEKLRYKAESLQQQFKQLSLHMEDTEMGNSKDTSSVKRENDIKSFQAEVGALFIKVKYKLEKWERNQMSMNAELERAQTALQKLNEMVKMPKMSRKRPADNTQGVNQTLTPSPSDAPLDFQVVALDPSAVVPTDTSNVTTTTSGLDKKRKKMPPPPPQLLPLAVIPSSTIVDNYNTTGNNKVVSATSPCIPPKNPASVPSSAGKVTGVSLPSQTSSSNAKSLQSQVAPAASPISISTTALPANHAKTFTKSPIQQQATRILYECPPLSSLNFRLPLALTSTTTTVGGASSSPTNIPLAQPVQSHAYSKGRKSILSREIEDAHYLLTQPIQPKPHSHIYTATSNKPLAPPYQQLSGTANRYYSPTPVSLSTNAANTTTPSCSQQTINDIYSSMRHLPSSGHHVSTPVPVLNTVSESHIPKTTTQANLVGQQNKCLICSMTFLTPIQLKLHHAVVHANNKNSAPAPDPCTGRLLVPSSSLQEHHQICHVLEPVSTIATANTTPTPPTTSSMFNKPNQNLSFSAQSQSTINSTVSLSNSERYTLPSFPLSHPAPDRVPALGTVHTTVNSSNYLFPFPSYTFYDRLQSSSVNYKE